MPLLYTPDREIDYQVVRCPVMDCSWKSDPLTEEDMGQPLVDFRDHLATHDLESLAWAIEAHVVGGVMAASMMKEMP